MYAISTTIKMPGRAHSWFALLILFCLSVLAFAQSQERLDPQASFDQRVTDDIFDDAGKWRQPSPPAEDLWRSQPDETVQDRRFHFGSDSAYEEMQYRNDDRFRTMGSEYDDIMRPSPLFKYNF